MKTLAPHLRPRSGSSSRRSNRCAVAGRRPHAAVLLAGTLAAALSLAAGGPVRASVLGAALDHQVELARRIAPELGVHVAALATGEEVYSYHADDRRILASNTKLLTTATALDLLGPGYFFETRVVSRGDIEGGTLDGDLAIVGGGDPNISGRFYYGDPLAVFRDWAHTLQRQGIARIAGDLVLVDGRFEPPRIHPDWPDDQLAEWYEAPVSALSFSDDCILVRVSPGPHPGAPARVELVPSLPLFDLRVEARTTTSVRRHRIIVHRETDGHTLTISGAVYLHAAPLETWVAVADPVEYFGAAVREAFAEEGIEIAGRQREERALPEGVWTERAVHRSDLLSTLQVTNKHSQNFYAESLIKTLGAERCGEGSWQAGRRVVGEFLGRVGIEPGSYQLADGSGMSRNDRFSPRQITRLLRFMFFGRWGPEFVRTLPFSGEDDLSWKRRLARPPYRGNVFAKTGTLDGVSALSGYAKATSGKLYVFSILCNRTRANWRARNAQDAIVRAIVDHG